jgi:hypothetical protein
MLSRHVSGQVREHLIAAWAVTFRGASLEPGDDALLRGQAPFGLVALHGKMGCPRSLLIELLIRPDELPLEFRRLGLAAITLGVTAGAEEATVILSELPLMIFGEPEYAAARATHLWDQPDAYSDRFGHWFTSHS